MLRHISPYVQHVITINTPPRFSISPKCFANRRAAHVLFCALWRRPSLQSLPTHATGSTLYVMGGRLWFLGHDRSSYMCTSSTLDVMDYELAEAIWVNNKLTARTLLILPISTPWSKLRRFSRRNTSKLHKHASYNIYHIHKCFYAFTCSNYIVQKLQMISAKQIIVLRHRRSTRIGV